MRIALVTHYYPAHRGGIEIVAGELARRLAERFAVVWHASDCDPPPAPAPRLEARPARTCNAVETRLGLPYPIWGPRSLRAVAASARESDAVHLHDCLYLGNVIACLAARLAGRPVVVTQHVGMVPLRNPIVRFALRLANRTLGRLVLGSAAQAVFVSPAVRDYFARFVRFRKPPLVIPNGVDGTVFRPLEPEARAARRRSLGIDAERPILLFVGRFVEKKGLPMLRELAARLGEAQWIFAGWGPLDPQAWNLPHVRVLKGLDSSALAPYYQAADLLVLPSVGEGFPLVVQEAMACGTPALVTDETAAGSPETQGLLLHEPADLERWTARLRELLASRDTLSALRPRVAAFAREAWSWQRCAERYAEVFAAAQARVAA